LLATRIVVLVDAVQNAAFALSQSLAYAVVHSKTLRAALFGLASITNKTNKTPGVFEFFYTISNQRLIEIACLRINGLQNGEVSKMNTQKLVDTASALAAGLSPSKKASCKQ
jgi:hypothetical protein